MKKNSKLRGIRAEVLQEDQMKFILGGFGSGLDGGNGSGDVYRCLVNGQGLANSKDYTSLKECETDCKRYGSNIQCYKR